MSWLLSHWAQRQAFAEIVLVPWRELRRKVSLYVRIREGVMGSLFSEFEVPNRTLGERGLFFELVKSPT